LNITASALTYHAAGHCVLPARVAEKRPALQSWKHYQERKPTDQEVNAWFSNPHDALCLVCGTVGSHLEMIDFDHRAELFAVWCARVAELAPGLVDRLFIESTPSTGRHVAYRVESAVCGNLKLAQRLIPCTDKQPVIIEGKSYKPRKEKDGTYSVIVTLIETRGEGGLFLCAPSPGYAVVQGDLAQLPVLTTADREILLEAAYSLNEYIPDVVGEPRRDVCGSANAPSAPGARPGDDFNARGDIRNILLKHGWTIFKPGENVQWCRPGKQHGTSATLKDGVFYVFSSNAAPFEANKGYAPFAVYTFLEHSGDYAAAATTLRAEGYGSDPGTDGVNIDGITSQFSREQTSPQGLPDPGPIPDELLRIPGFVSEVMDHCLDTAPYPNHVMAFCGALSLQAFLAGRKVRDASGNRTNLYLLGLAHSATGKDWPRKLNMRIAHRVGLARAVAERFASGEGLQDALCADPCMMFQTDEIDGMFRQVNGAQDARHENIITQLLMMYSSASTVFPMRKLAKQESAVIDQPCLVLFGTAIPNHYYDALSSRMLTNGLFARMIVLESGPRSKGKDAIDDDPPPRVLATAKWWSDFLPGDGNLRDWHPVPVIVEQTDEARAFLADAREHAESEYSAAEQRNDALGTTVWGRVDEQTRKLALLYAISSDHYAPRIALPSVQWAHALITHQTKRMLFMASSYVADNPFEADCLKLIRKLREAGGALTHSAALKNMHMPSDVFAKLIQTMEQRGEVQVAVQSTSGRPTRQYQLVGA